MQLWGFCASLLYAFGDFDSLYFCQILQRCQESGGTIVHCFNGLLTKNRETKKKKGFPFGVKLKKMEKKTIKSLKTSNA